MYESRLFVFRLVIVATTVGLSLLAWWGATSPRPRLVRAIVIWVAAMMLVAIRAPAPAIILVMTSAAAWAIVAIAWRWIEPSSAVWRFQLADLCVLLLFAATLAAILRTVPVRPSLREIVTGMVVSIPLAPVIAFTHLAVAGRWRWRMALAACLAILLAAIAMRAWQPFQTLNLLVLKAGNPKNPAYLFLPWLATNSALIWIAGEAIAGMRRARRSSPSKLPLGWIITLGLSTGMGVLLAARHLDELKSFAEHVTFDKTLLLALLLAVPVFSALSVAGAVWLSRPVESASLQSRIVARRLALVVAAVVALPATWLYWQMLWPPALPPAPPGKTHYDRILSIARELKIDPFDSSNTPPNAAEAMAVDELVNLLATPSHLPTNAVGEGTRLGPNSDDMSDHEFRKLFDVLRRALGAARSAGESDRACNLAIAQFQFLQMMSRRGPVGDDGYGLEILVLPSPDTISSITARKIIDVLETNLSGREDALVKYARSLAYHERRSGWPMRLELILLRGCELPENVRSHYESMERHAETQARSIQLFYAVKLFRDQHGRLPATLAEVIPDFLPALPRDQFGSEPMRYVVEGEKYRLYSVGPNGVDDGGSGDDRDFSWQGFQK